MKYAFLEKLADDNDITISDRDRIYDTCAEILEKVAIKWRNPFKSDIPTWREALGEQGKVILTKLLLPAAAVGGAAYAAKKLDEKVIIPGAAGQEAKLLLKNKVSILNRPEFASHQDKAEARFDEIAKIAPQVAMKPDVTAKLMSNSLHSGFTNDDVQRLAQIQAIYEKSPFQSFSRSENVSKALSKQASPLPSKDSGRLAATIVQILAEVGMDKAAAFTWQKTPLQRATNIAKQVLTTGAVVSGFGALVGAGAGAVNQAVDMIKRKQREKKLKESFMEAMRRSDPNRDPLHANKDKALQAFQTLTHFAPHVAADPEAARAFMINLISYDQGAQVSAIKDLSEIEKNLKATRGTNPFFEGMHAGTQAVGMPRALSSATSSMLAPIVEHSSSEIKRELGY